MADISNIRSKIEEITGAELGLSAAQLDDATEISETNITSLEFAEMIFRVEEEFGVSVEVLDMPLVETIGEVKQYVIDLVTGPQESEETTN